MDFLQSRLIEDTLGAATDEGGVVVVGFVQKALRGGSCCQKFHLVDEVSAPGAVDSPAEFALHRFELLPPRFAVDREIETTCNATRRPCVGRERWTDDRRPSTRQPRESGFRTVEAPQCFAQNVARSLHGVAILA